MSVLQMTKFVGYKTEVCEKHGEYESRPFQGWRRTLYSGCPECEEEQKAERKAREREEKKRAYYSRLALAGISKRFIDCTFGGYKPVSDRAKKTYKTMISYRDQFRKIKNIGTSMILCGRPGTGKTHLASAMAISLINQGFSTYYTTSFRMMARIKATYNKYDARETETGVIEDLATRDLLIIDEVGVQFGSDAEKILFYQVINGRYDNVLPTLLISNLTANELSEFIGERCFDRLKEGAGAVLVFNWDSYRK